MSFKWKAQISKNKIITREAIEEIIKAINYISNLVTAEGDIPSVNINIDMNNKQIMSANYLAKIQKELDYIKENNYCRQHGNATCNAKNLTDDSMFFTSRHETNQDNQFLSADLSVYTDHHASYFLTDDTNDYGSYNGSVNNTVKSSRSV